MSNVFKKVSLSALTLLLVLGLSGCASNKGAGNNDSDEMIAEGFTLELNGDSDSRKAGALQTILFPFDSNELTSDSKARLRANAEFLENNKDIKVQIEGHCDERGSIQYNLALGERRAKATREYLINMGISSSRISIISYGKERPVAYGHDNGAWSKNRRSNFVIVEK